MRALCLLLLAGGPSPELRREHGHTPAPDGVRVHFVRVAPAGPARGAVVLTHGAGSPGSAVWDLPHGCSVQAALAEAGFDTYALDVRGFGKTTYPPAFPKRPQEAAPTVRAEEVLGDVEAVVALARRQNGGRPVDLLGWSWGALVAGRFAGERPEAVRRVVLFGPVFDRKWPSRHVRVGAYREESRALHEAGVDPAREDPRVREAYVERLFSSVPPGKPLLLPNGPYRDLYGEDAPVWRPERVRAPTLVLRGADDRASLEAHARALVARLGGPASYQELPGADHFAFRTKASPALQAAILGFLEPSSAGDPPLPDEPK